jgi:hypothetical protein
VVSLVAGERVRRSWWGHPRGQAIFQVNVRLANHPDVLVIKLISGKVTFVERQLWPALLSVARAGQPWQRRGLSALARQLLQQVNKHGEVRTDRLALRGRHGRDLGEAARELEKRLLVYGEQFHTDQGSHAKRLETWAHWAERVGYAGPLLSPQEGKRRLETVVAALQAEFGSTACLPWWDVT